MRLAYETLDETPLPEHIKEALVEAGFDTPEKVLRASDEDLLAIKGIARAKLRVIRAEVRTDLDRALDPFRAIAAQYAQTFRSEYPAHSIVLDMQSVYLKVGDFLALHNALEE